MQPLSLTMVRSARKARLSVVLPVFNEEAVLAELHQRLLAAMEPMNPDFEVIFVDDGSTDATGGIVERLHDDDPRFKVIRFSRNFGHQAAVTAGLHYAQGDVVCVMDADLQDPPELLPSLLAEWERGSDVVYAVRRQRKEHWAKVKLYEYFYQLLTRLSSVPMPVDAGDFCLVSREVLDEMNRLPEKERFVRGLRAWVGFRQTGVPYERSKRLAGSSKYSLAGLARLALNGIVSFSDRPLIYVMICGLAVSGFAFIYAAYLIGRRLLLGGVITGYASIMGGLLFLSGLQLVGIGIVGLYLSKIFQEVKGRPTYVVSASSGFEKSPGSADTSAPPSNA